MHHLSDAELVEAVRQGDSEAFDALFERYYPEAVEYAARFATPELAPERATLAFSRLYRALLRGEHTEGDFSAILNAEVRSAHADFVRRGRKEVLVDDVDDDHELEAGDDLEDHPLRRAFGRLRPAWRKVLWYTVVLEESDEQVAERLGSTPREVAALWHRAHQGLRRACRAEHIDTPDDLGAALTPALLLGVPGLVTGPAVSEGPLVATVGRLQDARKAVLPALGVAAAVVVVALIAVALTNGSDPQTPTADAAAPSDSARPSDDQLPSSGQDEERGRRTEKPSKSPTTESPSPSETVVPTTPTVAPTTEQPTPTERETSAPAPTLAQQNASSFGSALLRYAKVTFAVTPLTADQVVVQASNVRMMSVTGAAVSCTSRSVSGGEAIVTCDVVQTQNGPFALTVNVTYADSSAPVSGSVALTGGSQDVSDGFSVAPE